MLESMNNMYEKEQERLARTNDRLERAGLTLVSVRSGVNSVLNKLVDVTLRPVSNILDTRHNPFLIITMISRVRVLSVTEQGRSQWEKTLRM